LAVRVSQTGKGELPILGHSKPARSEDNPPLFSPPPDDVNFSHQILRYEIPEHILDTDATKVVRRLTRYGHDAYLVGGCVRDILFGERPKDFDVATSALPGEIRKLFRNCRLIGRRFRLAHLFFKHQKIVEVATFRRGATVEDDVSFRHAAENLFGGPADDAIRRDFSINSLMYDVGRGEIHDFVGGLEDVRTRALNTIGDPNRRFPEDPVRIIRAVKFAVRLDLTIPPNVQAAIRRHAPLISQCAPARLVEEAYKILRTGRSARCFQNLHELGVLQILMPELAARIEDSTGDPGIWSFLEKLDRRVGSGRQVSDALLLSALVYPFCRPVLDENGDLSAGIHDIIAELVTPMTFPKRCLATVRQIVVAQRRLMAGPGTKRARRILARDYVYDAVDFMEVVVENNEERKLHAEWRRALGKKPKSKANQNRPFCPGPSGRRRRRRRPRRELRGSPE
jgi:poly(A) polymerase